MSKRSTILKIAGLDPIQERTHACNMAHLCDAFNCKHRRPHKPDEEECLIEDYCTELGVSFGGEKCICVTAKEYSGYPEASQ